jgi:hypothetical protein
LSGRSYTTAAALFSHAASFSSLVVECRIPRSRSEKSGHLTIIIGLAVPEVGPSKAYVFVVKHETDGVAEISFDKGAGALEVGL